MYNEDELLKSCEDLDSVKDIIKALQDECQNAESFKNNDAHKYIKFIKNMIYLLSYQSKPNNMSDFEFQFTYLFVHKLVKRGMFPESVLDIYDSDDFSEVPD
jgi:hypothetical protein